MDVNKRARKFMLAAHVGAGASVALLISWTFHGPDLVTGLAAGMLMASLVGLILRKSSDEFLRGMWNSGTQAAFVMICLLYIIVPVGAVLLRIPIEQNAGLIHTDTRPALLAIIAFFAAFHLHWWRAR